MPEITEAQLRERFSKEDFAGIYFLYGEEKVLIKREIQRLLKKMNIAAFPEFNQNELPHTATVDQIADAALALPFFAERKCVTVRDLDVEALDSGALKKLDELLESVPETTALVFYYPTLDFDPKKNAKWRSFLRSVEKNGFSVCYSRRSDSDLEKYLCRQAEKMGCTLSRRLAGKIVRDTGNDLNTLLNELQKLCAFVGSGEITDEQVDKIVTKNLETTVFLLSNALVRGNYEKAYGLLDLLLQQGEKPISILSVLSNAYIDMYRVRAAVESGRNTTAPMEYGDYKGRDFRLRSAANDMRDLSLETLRECLDLLLDADLTMKLSAQSADRITLETLFAKLLLLSHRGSVA